MFYFILFWGGLTVGQIACYVILSTPAGELHMVIPISQVRPSGLSVTPQLREGVSQTQIPILDDYQAGLNLCHLGQFSVELGDL